MADIQFSTGLTTYNLNGACEVAFNPTDSAFVENLYNTFRFLDERQEAYTKELSSIDTPKVFDFMRERDKEMREKIDELFGVPVCDKLFGSMNVYALSDGLPVWCNLLLAILDEVQDKFTAGNLQINDRIAKYTSKYKK